MRQFTLSFQGSPQYARLPFAFQNAESPKEITCVISSRSAGNMLCEADLSPGKKTAQEIFYRSLGADPAQVYGGTQVHGQKVLIIDRHTPNTRPQADGFITRDPSVLLSVTVADCLPVLFYDPESGGFGAVHSGWKGTGIALSALRLMEQEWHTRPEKVSVILGPCIQACCYRVDQNRAELFEKNLGGSAGAYPLGPAVRRSDDAWYISLQAANARLLVNAGVAEQNIAVCRNCTFTDERLGSFRREGPSYTRMTALIGFFPFSFF
ncbi:MAG: polyphenol oxidase family protein [Spirochaetaceae bacterium]|jgi:YfiH family protein|nr:polyphenol oxidase family protein [Spirochaetaceae bacterium]